MENVNAVKVFVTGAIAWISAKMGILAPILLTLFGIVIADWITGCCASRYEKKPLSSKRGYEGIIKKLSYFVAVGVALILDWLIISVASYIGIEISVKAMFSILISVWLILNEMLSILENLNRMEIKLPSFLQKAIVLFIGKVEQQGDLAGKENEIKEKAEV